MVSGEGNQHFLSINSFYKKISIESLDHIKLFIQSYSALYPISKNEIRKGLKLFYLKSLYSTWVEDEHYLRGNNRVDCFLEHNSYRLRFLTQHYDDLERFLLE